jgi:hypothetical protein
MLSWGGKVGNVGDFLSSMDVLCITLYNSVYSNAGEKTAKEISL